MDRKYPTKMFWFFVLTNFMFHFFYLSVPGIILCIVGIWVKSCLWIGLAVLGLDVILSIVDQLRMWQKLPLYFAPQFSHLIFAMIHLSFM